MPNVLSLYKKSNQILIVEVDKFIDLHQQNFKTFYECFNRSLEKVFVLLEYFSKHECNTIKNYCCISIGNNLNILLATNKIDTQIYPPEFFSLQ